MAVVSLDSPCSSGLACTFKLLPSKHTVSASGMLGHSPFYFRDQYMVSWVDKGQLALRNMKFFPHFDLSCV
jgi:hypothetical protein